MDWKLLAIYVGPDQVMPVASILATIMGFLLVFWGKLLGIIRKIFRLAPPPAETETTGSSSSARTEEKSKQG